MTSRLGLLLVVALLATGLPAQAQNLADSGQVLPGVWAGHAAWGDYDGDGDPDLALIGEASENGQVSRIARATAELIELGRDLRDDEFVLDARYHAGTYGIPDERTLDAMRLAARLEGMITDPVYEGKSMAGMIDLVATGEIPKDATVLYAHLGGQPALNAYSALFR